MTKDIITFSPVGAVIAISYQDCAFYGSHKTRKAPSLWFSVVVFFRDGNHLSNIASLGNVILVSSEGTGNTGSRRGGFGQDHDWRAFSSFSEGAEVCGVETPTAGGGRSWDSGRQERLHRSPSVLTATAVPQRGGTGCSSVSAEEKGQATASEAAGAVGLVFGKVPSPGSA